MPVEEILSGATVSAGLVQTFTSLPAATKLVAFFGDGTQLGDNTNLVSGGPTISLVGSLTQQKSKIVTPGTTGNYIDTGYTRVNANGYTVILAISGPSSGLPSEAVHDNQIITYLRQAVPTATPTNSPAFYTQQLQTNFTPGGTSISAITRANPGVVTTTAAHGLTAGINGVTLSGVGGMTQLSANQPVGTVPDSTDFDLVVDTSGFSAYTSGGTINLRQLIRTLPSATSVRVIGVSWGGTGTAFKVWDVTGNSEVVDASTYAPAGPTQAFRINGNNSQNTLTICGMVIVEAAMTLANAISQIYTPFNSMLKFRGITTA